jgi:putative FmdB family regulatory protein
MPIYEYVCGSCKKKIEVIQGMKDARLKICPSCGGKLTKAFSAPAIQFKGSGFYITDYARGTSEGSGSANRAADEKAEKAQGASEKSDKSEKAEKGDKSDKTEKPAKSESAGKSEKVEKAEKVEKRAEKKKEKKT